MLKISNFPCEVNRECVLQKLSKALIFQDIPVEIIDVLFKKWWIKVVSFHQWEILIHQWQTNCEKLFLLLSGWVDIFVHERRITQISHMTTLWEIGFINKSETRNATVQVNQKSYFLEFCKDFFEKIPETFQKTFYKNLMLEMSKKLSESNHHIATQLVLEQTPFQVHKLLNW